MEGLRGFEPPTPRLRASPPERMPFQVWCSNQTELQARAAFYKSRYIKRIMPVTVLRLGHRPQRDKRVTTHCALVARAFGAKELIYSGEKDPKFERTIRDVVSSWGGPFAVKYTKSWRSVIKSFKGKVTHLSMYGIPFENVKIPKGNLLVIVGAEKVPGEVYELADYNIAIGNQPHSEIGALAVFLYRLKGLRKHFSGAKLRITPMAKGKTVTTRKG